jgi:hypothetical protein
MWQIMNINALDSESTAKLAFVFIEQIQVGFHHPLLLINISIYLPLEYLTSFYATKNKTFQKIMTFIFPRRIPRQNLFKSIIESVNFFFIISVVCWFNFFIQVIISSIKIFS